MYIWFQFYVDCRLHILNEIQNAEQAVNMMESYINNFKYCSYVAQDMIAEWETDWNMFSNSHAIGNPYWECEESYWCWWRPELRRNFLLLPPFLIRNWENAGLRVPKLHEGKYMRSTSAVICNVWILWH